MNKIDVNELLQTASERTGLSDFGPADFMEGLTIFVEGVNTEAHIRDDSWGHLREFLLNMLINRLWFARDLALHPEILDEDLGSPIVMGSLPRTGSTKLHRMLAETGDFQTLYMWSTHKFARIPGAQDGGLAQRIQETREFEKWMYETSPDYATGHPSYTDEAEEDQFLMLHTFRHPLMFGKWQSLKYAQWIMQADMRPAFEYYVMVLKYLQWQSPSQRGKPWLVKTPSHMGNEAFLNHLFNNPKFIFTHRDPVNTVPSTVNTGMTMRKLYSDYDSSPILIVGLIDLLSNATTVHMRWREANPGVQVLDLGFREITQEGVSAVRKVYDFLGMPFSDAAISAVHEWERKNPKEKHGKANYSAEAIGSTDAAIREAFSPYINRYGKYMVT